MAVTGYASGRSQVALGLSPVTSVIHIDNVCHAAQFRKKEECMAGMLKVENGSVTIMSVCLWCYDTLNVRGTLDL